MMYFSVILLLAAALHVRADVMTTCEGANVQRISCASGVLRVNSIFFGREDSSTCAEGRPADQLTECAEDDFTGNIFKNRCHLHKECEIQMHAWGASRCPGIHRYLKTTYTCIPTKRAVACEGSAVHLQCDPGKTIFVLHADYGRSDHTVCSSGQPLFRVENTQCSRRTFKVGERCNGRNACSVYATNDIFGDPCEGTHKYLEVEYQCTN
uniref:L-rhamnose-binding lectin CSL2-like n=1 Tax=Doryrhamphus excisus TaxID=161450 RepID=UPI0025AE9294|nr:L-rhamnose-binding lectin CSL2-like [Doryrhamphus excisus]XP_057902033.1 L-rhamnose-binding lectin CSL2-like [Doryrhamphus excisus]